MMIYLHTIQRFHNIVNRQIINHEPGVYCCKAFLMNQKQAESWRKKWLTCKAAPDKVRNNRSKLPPEKKNPFFFCIAYAILFIFVYHQNSFEILFEDEILFEGIITTNIANWHLGFSRTIALLPKTLQLPHLNFKLDEILQ